MKAHRIKKLGVVYASTAAFLVVMFLPGLTGIGASTIVDSKEARASLVAGTRIIQQRQESELEPKYTHWKVEKKGCTYPGKLYRGVGFIVKGEIVSARPVTYATGTIENKEGDVLYGHRVKMKENAVDLSVMDAKLLFSQLDEGTYRYLVCLYDENGDCNNVIDKEFQVLKREWSWPVYGGAKGDGWCCECSAHHGRHYGVDIKGPGRQIHATADGTVVYAKYHKANSLGSYGKLLIIYHGGGVYSYYAHCDTHYVKAGDKVKRGEVVAIVGATGRAFGPHLHFELRKGPVFQEDYDSDELIDKSVYTQFNPLKKGYIKAGSY